MPALAMKTTDLIAHVASAKEVSILSIDCPSCAIVHALKAPPEMSVGLGVAAQETHLAYKDRRAGMREFLRLEAVVSDLREQQKLDVDVTLRIVHADGSYQERVLGPQRYGSSSGSQGWLPPAFFPVPIVTRLQA